MELDVGKNKKETKELISQQNYIILHCHLSFLVNENSFVFLLGSKRMRERQKFKSNHRELRINEHKNWKVRNCTRLNLFSRRNATDSTTIQLEVIFLH